MKKNLVIALLFTLVTTVMFGILYPLAITGLAQVFFPDRANGQLIQKDNLGLDPRDSDDKDKIKQARDVILKPIDAAMKRLSQESAAIMSMQRSLKDRRNS